MRGAGVVGGAAEQGHSRKIKRDRSSDDKWIHAASDRMWWNCSCIRPVRSRSSNVGRYCTNNHRVRFRFYVPPCWCTFVVGMMMMMNRDYWMSFGSFHLFGCMSTSTVRRRDVPGLAHRWPHSSAMASANLRGGGKVPGILYLWLFFVPF